MSWKAKQNWNVWQEWAPEPAYYYETKKPEKRGNDKQKKAVLYDGKAVELEESGSALPRSSSSSQSDSALKEENQKLRETMKFLVEKIVPKEEDQQHLPEAVQEVLKTDPREIIKQKQKALNQERKALNKVTKVRETMDRKEKSFSEWKYSIQEGIRKEEKRVATEVAELREELRSIEAGKEDPLMVADSDDENKIDQAVQGELRAMRQEFRGLTSYTAHLEAKNAAMMEQMQAQMSAIMGALQGATLTTGPRVSSPQQPLVRKKTIGTEILSTREDGKERADRSRSPDHGSGLKRIRISKECDYTSQELKAELNKYPDQCQQIVLQTMSDYPRD